VGIHIHSHFADKYYKEAGIANLLPQDVPRTNESLKALRDHSSTDDNTEKREILALVANRHIRGLAPEDFHRKHILCFDHATKVILEMYRQKARHETGDVFPTDNIDVLYVNWDRHNLKSFIEQLENQVKAWAERHFFVKYHGREKIFRGKWRTTRFMIHETQAQALEVDNQKLKRDIEYETGTHIACSKKREQQALVTIYKENKDDDTLIYEALQLAAREVSLAW
jgi:hypothetical protein